MAAILYRGAVDVEGRHDPAAVIEDLFEANGWGDTWRNGIYDYVHYHSKIHEVLGIARGKGRVRFGGAKGRIFTLKAGDIAVLPAGTGHQCLLADDNFLVVGAYPPAGTYNECTTVEDRPRALKMIPKVADPARTLHMDATDPCRNSGRRADDRIRRPLPGRRGRRISIRDAAVPSSALAVPASLHASPMARLDRLGPAKDLAQIGSAIGWGDAKAASSVPLPIALSIASQTGQAAF